MKKSKNNAAGKLSGEPKMRKAILYSFEKSRNVPLHFKRGGYLFARLCAFLLGYEFLWITLPPVDNFLIAHVSFPQALLAEWITLFPFLLFGFLNSVELFFWLFCIGFGYITGFAVRLIGEGTQAAQAGSVLFLILRIAPAFFFAAHDRRMLAAKLIDMLLILLVGFFSALVKYIFLYGR